MRQKKPYKVLTFATTTDAMKMEKVAAKEGIAGRIIPLPTVISAGCGLSWRIGVEEFEDQKDRIQALDINIEGIYEVVI